VVDEHDAETAATVALEEFVEETGATAGLIVFSVDAGSDFNSPAMQTATE
jgi:hypothetical protein